MFKHITTKLTLLAAGLLGAAGAQAADGGWFVDGSVGVGRFDHRGIEDNHAALGADVGYRWGQFGVEGGYQYLGSFSDHFSSGTTSEDVKLKVKGYTLGVNGKFPLSDKWFLSAHAGLFRWDVSENDTLTGGIVPGTPARFHSSDTGTDWYGGIGAGYNINQNVSVSLNLDHYAASKHGVDADVNVAAAKLEYRFP